MHLVKLVLKLDRQTDTKKQRSAAAAVQYQNKRNNTRIDSAIQTRIAADHQITGKT